eukprot:16386482-Heterocapsa_arctica.AAC.1
MLPPTVEIYVTDGMLPNAGHGVDFPMVMDDKLATERQARKDRNAEHRRIEHERVGVLIPHEFLKDTKFDYWSIRYYSMSSMAARRPDLYESLRQDARRR